MPPKVPTVKVRVLRGFYYMDPLPNDAWSKTPTPKTVGAVILMKLVDAIEARTANKVAFIGHEPVPTPSADAKKEQEKEQKAKEEEGKKEKAKEHKENR